MEIKQRFKSYDEFMLAFIEQIQLRERIMRQARRKLLRQYYRGVGVLILWRSAVIDTRHNLFFISPK